MESQLTKILCIIKISVNKLIQLIRVLLIANLLSVIFYPTKFTFKNY